MYFGVFLYISLAIFAIGVICRIVSWLRIDIGSENGAIPLGDRIKSAGRGIAESFRGRNLLKVVRSLIVDAILQAGVFKTDFKRWLMHALIFFGFIGLLLMHALENVVTQPLFSGYQSTLNPYLALRDLMGLMVIAGVTLAVVRRVRIHRLRRTTNRMDVAAIAILAVIIVSGYFLKSAQIISEPLFYQMTRDYMGTDDPEELMPLKAYWGRHYGVLFDDPDIPSDAETLALGAEEHAGSCASCHHRPVSAVLSYPIAKAIAPAGNALNARRADITLWYIHFLASFAGLAYLPFSRFFHLISSPVSLMAKAVSGHASADPAARANLRALGFDACTHCAACSVSCSVGPAFEVMGNPNILPSERLAAIARIAKGTQTENRTLAAVCDGSHICTDCYRCTTLCPAGIDLQDIWRAARAELEKRGYSSPYNRMKEDMLAAAPLQHPDEPISLMPEGPQPVPAEAGGDFSACFGCQTCTNACPVVGAFDNPGEALTLLPHQIMHAMGLGLEEAALSARMLWDCTTCYKCQEQCPQGVPVTDVLYALKNKAWRAHNGRKAA